MIIQEEHNIDFFKNQMPNKPYCTNNLDMGLSIRNKAKALEMLYLQANQPAIQTCLLFDLDKKIHSIHLRRWAYLYLTLLQKHQRQVVVTTAIC